MASYVMYVRVPLEQANMSTATPGYPRSSSTACDVCPRRTTRWPSICCASSRHVAIPIILAHSRVPMHLWAPVSSRSHSACMSRVNCGDRCISTYVQEASKFSAQSKMGIDNLAMVFAPNVLRARNETLQQIMEDTNYIKIVLRSLIEACDRL